jgi:hypothetical protein
VNWDSKHLSPAHIIVVDHVKQNLVVCIRGTLSAPDAISDAICVYVEFQVSKGARRREERREREGGNTQGGERKEGR